MREVSQGGGPPATAVLGDGTGDGRRRWATVALVCLGQLMVVLDATVVNVALPPIQADLSVAAADLQWVITAYVLAFGGFLLLGGRASDLLGRRSTFLAGVLIFAVASLLCGVAASPGQLIVFRALQGLGAAALSPAALAILTTTFPAGRDRTTALAIWAGIGGAGGAIGLLLGGALTDAFSWRWVFLINVPVGLLAIVLGLRLLPAASERRPSWRELDLGGAVGVTVGIGALIFAVAGAEQSGWTSSQTLIGGAVGLLGLASFVAIEARHPEPLMPLRLFTIRSIIVGNGAMLLLSGALQGTFFFTAIYVQRVMGYSPFVAGASFVPLALAIVAGTALARPGIDRFGPFVVAMLSLTATAVGLVGFTRLSATGSYLGEVLPAVLVLAVGLGGAFVCLTLLGTSGVEPKDAGLASGVFSTAQQVGGALGLAVLASIAASHTASFEAPGSAEALVAGYHLGFTVAAAVVCAAGILVLALLRPGSTPRRNLLE